MSESSFDFGSVTDEADDTEPSADGGIVDETSSSEPDTQQTTGIDYELSENVVEDLVAYTRSKTVKNEEQFVLTALSQMSGLMDNTDHYVSYVLIGTAGSGKSHLQNTVDEIFPNEWMYQTTSGTDKSIIYDDDWNDALFASLDELNKPSDELIEILKSLHGGEDGQFRYKVTGGGRGADREVDEIVRDAMPFGTLYAQYEPDFEMWDRLIKIPVHESKEKNDGVAATQWDHSMVSFGDSDKQYMRDFSEGEKALRQHIRNLPQDAYVKLPAGEDEFGWNAYEHARCLFDIARSETNRVSNQIANLVRCSALLNHRNRERREMYIENEGWRDDVIVAEPQDLANILATREVLLATTHQLDRKRKAICVAIDEVGGTERMAPIKHPQDRQGQPKSIMGYLRKTNASFVKKTEIRAMLKDLQDNGLVEKLEGAGEHNRTLYQFQSWQKLGKFEINESFKDVFSDVADPFEAVSFVERARELNAELTPDASEFIGEDTVETGSDSDGQATLDASSSDSSNIELAPYEEMVAERLHDTLDGVTVENLDEHEPSIREMIGLVELGADADDLDSTEDTLISPDHEVWTHGPDEWVESVADAEQEVENAIRRLTQEGVFRTNVIETTSTGQPLSMTISVEPVA